MKKTKVLFNINVGKLDKFGCGDMNTYTTSEKLSDAEVAFDKELLNQRQTLKYWTGWQDGDTVNIELEKVVIEYDLEYPDTPDDVISSESVEYVSIDRYGLTADNKRDLKHLLFDLSADLRTDCKDCDRDYDRVVDYISDNGLNVEFDYEQNIMFIVSSIINVGYAEEATEDDYTDAFDDIDRFIQKYL